MKTAREIALIGIYTALLIGGQFALSAISGVEVVTVLFLSFCYCFGIRRGLLVSTAFSLLRCLVFGFFPTVVMLYLIYYSLFAVVFGGLGMKFKRQFSAPKLALLVAAAVLMTILFTALDDAITPLFYGYSRDAAKAYAVASLTALFPQVICTAVTVGLLFPVLYRIFSHTDFMKNK